MTKKQAILWPAAVLAILLLIPGLNVSSAAGRSPASLFAAAAADETDTVRVTVRFARARSGPDASAPIVKEIGFGTLLRVLGRSGDYFQVVTLDMPAGAAAEPWYVHRDEVDAVPPAVEQALVDKRRIGFVPASPAAGQAVVFTARHFRTPSLLKWDMGDGSLLTAGSKASQGQEVIASHVYAEPGLYVVKVYDDNGDMSLPPITIRVMIAPSTPRLSVDPEQPRANHPVTVERRSAAAPPISSSSSPGRGGRPPTAVVTQKVKYSLVKFSPFAGFFQPRDEFIKEIYGEGDVLYGARLGIHVWQGFYFWLSASQFKVIGKTTVTEDKTTLTLLPISGAMRYHLGRGFFVPYAGIGLSFLHFKEESELVGNTSGNGRSLFFEGGIELRINRHFSFDLGARFDQVKVKPENAPQEVELGGVQATAALLVSF